MAEELEHEPQPQEPRTELPEEGAAPADGAEPEKKEKKPSEDLFYWLNALTTALVSLVLVFTFIGRLTRVQGGVHDQHPPGSAAPAGLVSGL